MATASRLRTLSQWWVASSVSRVVMRSAAAAGLGDTGELQHPLHVIAEDDPRLGEVLQPVVRLIGQRKPALHEERDVPRRVARVGLDVEQGDPADPIALERADGAQQRRDRVDRVDGGELVGERRGAGRGDALVSMKLVYRSPILRDSVPGSASCDSSTIARTSFSACSAMRWNEPHRALSSGISVRSSHAPLTWRNRSSWGRISALRSSSMRPDRGASVIAQGYVPRRTSPAVRGMIASRDRIVMRADAAPADPRRL